MSAAIRFERRLPVALGYHVLAQVDLGADAAQISRGSTALSRWLRPGWARDLERALRDGGPRCGWVQFAPLQARDVEALAGSPDDPRPGAQAWHHAITRAAPAYARRFGFGAADHARDRVVGAAYAALLEPLTTLRARLWAPDPAPPLTVVDAPALRHTGRAVPGLVAVALDREPQALLCQIFHEDVHAVTDRRVLRDRQAPGGVERDTRAGTAGHAVHRALEAEALDHGDRVLREALPALLPSYRAWRASFR